ncbi:hypothetical protein O7635_28950 [Asanoa sp. WMMD1127]|uniref:hypothetical protein n=1 Tax=Asanoa sp. WMMD1127 TaxID=3016107 RepID=UPI002417ED7F|nr:hypothetical protein [Asanoa sp. WMMD1127]MDG4825895.1 hypothetical protein [Asanoa sp. WMMD1127]
MRDLETWYAALASDVDGSGLPSAGDLRRAADRHARRRASVVGGAVVTALTAGGGVALLGGPATTPPEPPRPTAPAMPTPTPLPAATSAPPTTAPTTPPASPASPASPSSPSVTSARPVIRSIPERAFFDLPRDMTKEGNSRSPSPAGLEAPMLCDNPLRDDAASTARRSFNQIYKGANEEDEGTVPAGVVTQTIIAYRPGGADDLMRRVRADLDSCDTRTAEGLTTTITSEPPPSYGDEAIQVLEVVKQGQRQWDLRAVIVRVGDVVTVVTVDGWEDFPSDPADLRLFARLAIETIEEWRS